MTTLHRSLGCFAVMVAVAMTAGPMPVAARTLGPTPVAATTAPSSRAVCGPAAPGEASCLARVSVDRPAAGTGTGPGSPDGLNPADLQAAYRLPSGTAGTGQTVAVIDAYDDPHAEADLGTYRRTFGLPPCTTASGCFRKLNENGGTAYPKGDAGWAEEISLDIDAVSAACPNCHIILVEASTAKFLDLGTAVNTAVASGANVVNNSYGGPESSNDTVFDSQYFNHPGVAITASTGDSGFGVSYPASSRFVTAVGGTTLSRDSSARGWSETAWSGSGSGCSVVEPQAPWQAADPAIPAVCGGRAVADVAAVADPDTGVSVYDTYKVGGWGVVGGTSVGSALVAGVYGLAGNAASAGGGSYVYAHASGLFNVVSGSNGSCGGTALCTAGVGWNGPTGLGTPDGTAAF